MSAWKSFAFDGTAGCRSPILTHILQDVLSIGWVPHGVTSNHVIRSARSHHHARLHIAACCLWVHHIADTLRHTLECHDIKRNAPRLAVLLSHWFFSAQRG